MSSLTIDAQFFRGILVGLVLATVMSGAGIVYAVIAVHRPPTAMTISEP